MSIDEIEKECDHLGERIKELCELPDDEFLNEKVGNELDEINKKLLDYAKMVIKGE